MAGAIRLLLDRGLRFTCLVAGDGEEGAWLRDFASRHRLTELRMLGNRTAEEMCELLAISDVYFLPSRHEGISLAIFEAMAMSAAVVAADVGGQKELVTPECGYLIERTGNQTEEYAEALAELLANPSRRREMAALARQRVVEHFRLDEMGRRMAEILRGRPSDPPFDLGKAFQSFAPGFAREIIEQRRAESIADQMWSQRLTPPSMATGGAAHTGHKTGVENLYRAMALLYPLCGGAIHSRNRRLLFRVLSHRRARRDLQQAFDPVFYRCSNPDVPRRGPLPLLHYVFYGYREGRRPSPDFDSEAFSAAYPEEPGDRSNPLLRKIVMASGSRRAWHSE
jgi:hypothetical protein